MNQDLRFRSNPVSYMFPKSDMPAVAVVDDVFEEALPQRLIELARANRDFFMPSTILDGKVTDQRRSRTCHEIEDVKSLLQQAISRHFAAICTALTMSPFQLGPIEAQLTFHQDGDFFRFHRDNRALVTRSRLISYVYYFRTEAADFTGGELRLYQTEATQDTPDASAPRVTIEPLHNRIVFFPSNTLHEVLPITSLSDDFIDGRGSIVGWLRTNDLARILPMPASDGVPQDAHAIT